MTARAIPEGLRALYEADETAWLDAMAALAAARQTQHFDFDHLAEFLSDMAKRDRREVLSRLTVLVAHLLKWEYQPERRTPSWELTIADQRRELQQLLDSGTLRNHAAAEFDRVYAWAVADAVIETRFLATAFPAASPFTLEQVLGESA